MTFEYNQKEYDLSLEEIDSVTLDKNSHITEYKDNMSTTWKVHKIQEEATYFKIEAFKFVELNDIKIVEDDHYGIFNINYRDAVVIRVNKNYIDAAIRQDEIELEMKDNAEVIAVNMMSYKYKQLYRYNYNELRNFIEVPIDYDENNSIKIIVKGT